MNSAHTDTRENKLCIPEILDIDPVLKVIDVGAAPWDDEPVHKGLLHKGRASVIGFEPEAEAFKILTQHQGPNETFLPHALGDGARHKFHICQSKGWNSLYPPNHTLLQNFHWFDTWAAVQKIEEIDTVRLDDIPEVMDADFIKLDIQGAELMVLENGVNCLKNVVAIESEVQFLPLYENAPLYSEVELFLRKLGFQIHRFTTLESRTVKPLMINNDPLAKFSQLVWADALFIRNITDLAALPPPKLIKLAMVTGDMYGSLDIAVRALVEHDKLTNLDFAEKYMAYLGAKPA